VRRLAAAVMLVLAGCTASEPAADVVRPTARSLLPPSADPSASPSASPSGGPAGGSGSGTAAGADTSEGAAAPAAAAAKPTPKPTPKPTKRPEQPAIEGTVTAGGRPVTDAQVTISGSGYHHNTTTSSSGRFRSATPPGTYTVAANSPSVSGCAPKTVTVQPNAVSNVTITCSG
jgi:hypothetical protein